MDVDADLELDEVEHLCLQGDVRIEVVELEVRLVDLDDGDVQQDVGEIVVELPGSSSA